MLLLFRLNFRPTEHCMQYLECILKRSPGQWIKDISFFFTVSAKHSVAQRHSFSLQYNPCVSCQAFMPSLFWAIMLSLSSHFPPLLTSPLLSNSFISLSVMDPSYCFPFIYYLFFISLSFTSVLGCKHSYSIWKKFLFLCYCLSFSI